MWSPATSRPGNGSQPGLGRAAAIAGCRVVARVIGGAQPSDELGGIETDGLGDLQELHDVEPSLAPLVLGHEGLRPVEPSRHTRLGQVGLDAHLLQLTPEARAPRPEA